MPRVQDFDQDSKSYLAPDGLSIFLHLSQSDNVILARLELLLKVKTIPTNQHDMSF